MAGLQKSNRDGGRHPGCDKLVSHCHCDHHAIRARLAVFHSVDRTVCPAHADIYPLAFDRCPLHVGTLIIRGDLINESIESYPGIGTASGYWRRYLIAISALSIIPPAKGFMEIIPIPISLATVEEFILCRVFDEIERKLNGAEQACFNQLDGHGEVMRGSADKPDLAFVPGLMTASSAPSGAVTACQSFSWAIDATGRDQCNSVFNIRRLFSSCFVAFIALL